MIDIIEQKKLFIEIGGKLSRPITAYAIGGTAMLFLGLKETTLDVDLVFTNAEDRKVFQKAAMSLAGYEELDTNIIYRNEENLPEMVKLPNSRLDLFLNTVINFHFSDSVKSRGVKTHQFDNNLIIKVASPEDILLMKSATSRAKDEEDIISIIKSEKINWDVIIQEAQTQINLGNETAVLTLGTRLEEMQNLRIKIPEEVLDKLWNLLEKQVKEKSWKNKR